jgi:hypothetical protein
MAILLLPCNLAIPNTLKVESNIVNFGTLVAIDCSSFSVINEPN